MLSVGILGYSAEKPSGESLGRVRHQENTCHKGKDTIVELINRYAEVVKVPVVLKLEDDKYLQLADFRRDLFVLDSSTNGKNKQNIKNFVENLLNKRDSYMPVPLDLCAMEIFGQDIVRSIYERKNFC